MIRIKEELMDVQPYKPGKPVDEVKRELGLKEAVKLASNENPFGPSRLALSALRKNLNEVNRYPDGGCYYLRKKLAKRHSISDDRLIFGNGSDELIVLAIKALLNKGDTVIIAEPTFLIYRLASKIAGMKTKFIPLKNLKYDLASMTAAIDDSTKMIFIANPDNPTGTYVNDEEVKAFIEMVPDDVLLFFDEAYYEYAIDGDYPDTLNYQDKSNISRWKKTGEDLRDRGNTWFIPYETIRKSRPHPTVFPVKLPEMCLKVHGMRNIKLVMDPFMGIGSTAVACKKLNIDFIGFEIDKSYVDIASERLAEM